MTSLIVIIALIVSGGAGVSVIANNSLPGDTLYGVKINVNESVRHALAVGIRAETQLEAKLADRRLKEAEQLAVREKLTTETRALIEERFTAHAEAVRAGTAELETINILAAADVGAAFEADLRAHEQILLGIPGTPASGPEIQALLVSVRASVAQAGDARTRVENAIISGGGPNVQAAARGKLTAAENKVAEVEKVIARAKERTDAGAVAEAEARLEVAKNTLASGRVKIESGVYDEAFPILQKAIRIASEAQALVVARGSLGIGTAPPSGADPGAHASSSAEAGTYTGTSTKTGVKLEIYGDGAATEGELELEPEGKL